MQRMIVIALAVGTLAACETILVNNFATVPGCCTSLSELKFHPTARGRSTYAEVVPDSPAFTFETGRSRTAAFELTRDNPPVLLRIGILNRGSGNVSGYGELLCPTVTFLNGKYEIMGSVAADPDFPIEQPTPGVRSFRIAVPSGASFAVVHTTDAMIGRPLGETITPVTAAIPGAGAMEFTRRVKWQCGPYSAVTVRPE